MEKLAPFINWIKTNRFWLICGVLFVSTVATFFMVTGAIQKQTDEYTTNIKNHVNSTNRLLNVSAEEDVKAHPNSSSEAGMQLELSTAVDKLVEAWKIRYSQQESILKWPMAVIENERFVEEFSRYDPPETFPESKADGRGLERYLELYRTKIPRQMVHLCKDILRAKWYFDENEASTQVKDRNEKNIGGANPIAGAFGGDTKGEKGKSRKKSVDQDELTKYAVVWDQDNQSMWHLKLTQFQNLDDNKLASNNPTPLQVYMLQQDLWLLEAMFTIIRSVNGDVDANDLATIKRIDHVAFGRDIHSQVGTLIPADARLAGSGNASKKKGTGKREKGARSEKSKKGAKASSSSSPYDRRYVDQDYNPHAASEVRSILTGEKLPSQNIELIVAKRVPVRIALRMDERKIAEFIAACANSPFSFEINQVRLNRHNPGEGIVLNGGAQANSGSGINKEGGAFGGANMLGKGMEGPGQKKSGKSGSSVLSSSGSETRTSYDVDVEFYGVVKIYNPVREQILRKAIGEDAARDAAGTNQSDSGASSS